jgi:NTE family protein
MTLPSRLALVLGGGNALGSYQAGVWQRLGEAAVEPERIVATSVGAINGAIIAGNAPERRVERLQAFWRGEAGWRWPGAETLRRSASVLDTMVGGRAGMFGPVGPLGSWWDPDPAAAVPALFDSKPLAATLARLVDFDRLNAARFAACAIELETGREVLFDTAATTVGPDHVRASGALLPTFPAVEIEGVVYADGGFAQNLPLDAVLAEPGGTPLLCLAVDLTPASSARPRTLGEAMAKAQDLIFAAQSARTVAKWQAVYAAEERLRTASVTLVRLVYRDQADEVAGKAMDFSPASVAARWEAGYRDAGEVLARLADGRIATGEPGLRVETC